MSMGFGPVPGIMQSEIFPLRARGVAQTISIAVAGVLAFAVTYAFLPLENVIHSYGVFWLYAGVCFLGILFGYFFLPETKGKSLEEIERIFSRMN